MSVYNKKALTDMASRNCIGSPRASQGADSDRGMGGPKIHQLGPDGYVIGPGRENGER